LPHPAGSMRWRSREDVLPSRVEKTHPMRVILLQNRGTAISLHLRALALVVCARRYNVREFPWQRMAAVAHTPPLAMSMTWPRTHNAWAQRSLAEKVGVGVVVQKARSWGL